MVDLEPGQVQKAEIIKDNEPIKTISPEGLSKGKFELGGGEFLVTTVTF